MFIRIKKIRQYKYAYLVENRWRKAKGARQKVKAYLGRVFTLERKASKGYRQFFQIDDLQKHISEFHIENIFRNLVYLELINHGFSPEKGKEDLLKKGTLLFHFRTLKLKDTATGKDVALELNDNFMCSFTLNKLFAFTYKPDADNYKELATVLVESGLKVENELFVLIHTKLQKSLTMNFNEFVENIGY